MKEVFEILRSIEMNSSRNAKKILLVQNSDNENLKKFFLYAYDQRVVFGIGVKSLKKIPKKIAPITKVAPTQMSLFARKEVPEVQLTIFELLDELSKHPHGSGADVSLVQNFLSTCDEEAYYWYTKLILKDLKIGCTENTINEVWEGYIPKFEVMLAHPYSKHADKIKGVFQLQRKLDGYRFVTILNPGKSIEFFTRNGLKLYNFPEIEADLKEVAQYYPKPIVLDGELIAKDNFNDTQKLVLSGGEKRNLIFHVFDWMYLEEFESGTSVNNLLDRYDSLQIPELNFVKRVPELYRGTDLSEITNWFNTAKLSKWEGIMVKLDAKYVRTRTTNMLKVKEFETLDLRVLRVNVGTGKNEGRLGSVTVDFEGNEVDVGTGFDDYSRELLWSQPNLIIDKIIEVQYFEKTTNESGKPSLRFPVFKMVRCDK